MALDAGGVSPERRAQKLDRVAYDVVLGQAKLVQTSLAVHGQLLVAEPKQFALARVDCEACRRGQVLEGVGCVDGVFGGSHKGQVVVQRHGAHQRVALDGRQVERVGSDGEGEAAKGVALLHAL